MVPISTTSLRAMSECARGFASRYIFKHGHGDTKATFKGNYAHSEFEKIVYDPSYVAVPDHTATPKEVKAFTEAAEYAKNFIDAIRRKGGVLKPEVWVAINRDGSASKYGAAHPPYIRIKTDLYWQSSDGRTLGTWDWKSGTWVPDEDEVDYTQTRLTALALLKQKPNADKVVGGTIYTAHKKIFPLVVTRDEIDPPTGGMQDLLVQIAQYEEAQKVDMSNAKATRGRWCAFCRDSACPYNPSI